jgi:hypothetical protein
LVLSQLQEVEVKQLKSGEPREKVNYAGAPQCLEYLQKRIAEARSEGEVLEGSRRRVDHRARSRPG